MLSSTIPTTILRCLAITSSRSQWIAWITLGVRSGGLEPSAIGKCDLHARRPCRWILRVQFGIDATGDTIHQTNDLRVSERRRREIDEGDTPLDEAEGDVERHAELRVDHHFRPALLLDRLAYQCHGGLHRVDDNAFDRVELEIWTRRELQHRIQAEQRAGGRSGAQRAGGAGRMEAAPVRYRRLERGGNTAGNLEPGDDGFQKALAARTTLLRQCREKTKNSLWIEPGRNVSSSSILCAAIPFARAAQLA